MDDLEFIDYLSDLIESDDPDVVYEGSATSRLEQQYKETIKMAETRAKLAEKSAKLAKDIFKKALKRMDAYVKLLEADQRSFQSVAEAFRAAGYEGQARQCEEKAQAIGELVASHKAYKSSIEQEMDSVSA